VARSLGPVLPDRLLGRLLGPDGEALRDDAVVLLTVDPYGWPHPALLSYAEVVAVDAGRLRLGLHRGSRTTRHLRDSGRATLVFADEELVLYVKAEAVPLPDIPAEPALARFELGLQDVLDDQASGEETGARLGSGLVVVWPGRAEEVAARARRIRDALRR
jgi:hypothetical protein